MEARIDHRSLADRRDAAARDGDLDRAAELSREPNVHLGPSRHRAGGGAAAREKRRKARRVEQANAAHAAERDTARRQVARVERELAAVGARLKETYDRVRRALDARIQHARRALRTGAAAVKRSGLALGRAGAPRCVVSRVGFCVLQTSSERAAALPLSFLQYSFQRFHAERLKGGVLVEGELSQLPV